MDVFLIFMRTSIGPTSGSGTSWIHRPSSAFDLTSAFMIILLDDYREKGQPNNENIAFQRVVKLVN